MESITKVEVGSVDDHKKGKEDDIDTRRLSGTTLNSFAYMDVAELSLLDVLTQAATDVLVAIPSQRCIVYVYDKAANLLRPEVIMDYNDKEAGAKPHSKQAEFTSQVVNPTAETGNRSTAVDNLSEDAPSMVSFPPVVGMVSVCFLQKRCLRMHELNPHRSFHREYDVPKDMQVESILCAPVILYHRVAAVIKLLNRLDTVVDRFPFDEVEHVGTPHESGSEVKLRRLKTVKATAQTGFSVKDEQKLLHLTMHIAQIIEMNEKKLATVRSHAKLREDKAKKALDLLNTLNGKRVVHIDGTEALLPARGAENMSHSMRRESLTKLASQSGAVVDMLSALGVIMRLQAIFRGRRQRRADKFAEELEKFKRQRELMKTMLVMQRVGHAPEEPKAKPKVSEKAPIKIKRTKEGTAQSRIPTEEPKKVPPTPSKPPRTTSITPTTPTTPIIPITPIIPTKPTTPQTKLSTPITPRPPPQQPVAPSSRPSTELTRIQTRRSSATKIQKVFRRHQQRKQKQKQKQTPSSQIVKPVHEKKSAKETATVVQMQPFVRENLVRKKLRQSLRSHKGPQTICLRIASQNVSNQSSHDNPRSAKLRSQTCVYVMPGRPGKNHPMHRRLRISRDANEDTFDERLHNIARYNHVAVESRRLVAMHKSGDSLRMIKSSALRSKPLWDRLASPVVWEPPGHEIAPPGVEFVRHPRPNSSIDLQSKIKAHSPRIASMTISQHCNNQSVKLPILGPRPQHDSNQGSLLCCLLPTQVKSNNSLLAMRPIAQLARKAFQAKHRQSPLKAGDSGDATA